MPYYTNSRYVKGLGQGVRTGIWDLPSDRRRDNRREMRDKRQTTIYFMQRLESLAGEIRRLAAEAKDKGWTISLSVSSTDKIIWWATAGESEAEGHNKKIVIGGHVWDNASSECFRAIGLALQFWISVSISPQVIGSNLITVHI